jgi:hypothetical protein
LCQFSARRRIGADSDRRPHLNAGLGESIDVLSHVRSVADHQPAQKQQSPRLTNDRRREDLTGLVPQFEGLFVALSFKRRFQ